MMAQCSASMYPNDTGNAERRSTARAQAAYWTRDDLPALDDMIDIDWPDDKSTFLVAVDADGDTCSMLSPDSLRTAGAHTDIADTVPRAVLPHVAAAIREAGETRKPVPCEGIVTDTSAAQAIAWRSIFLPLRNTTDDPRTWLIAAFGCKHTDTGKPAPHANRKGPAQ